jgi:serine/threonine protein kinase
VPKKVIENYSYCLHDQIGKGFNSTVYQGKNDKTDEDMAIKVVEMRKI